MTPRRSSASFCPHLGPCSSASWRDNFSSRLYRKQRGVLLIFRPSSISSGYFTSPSSATSRLTPFTSAPVSHNHGDSSCRKGAVVASVPLFEGRLIIGRRKTPPNRATSCSSAGCAKGEQFGVKFETKGEKGDASCGGFIDLEDGSVSDRHAALVIEPAGCFVEDLGSAEGTRRRRSLSGRLTSHRLYEVISGMILFFGNVPVQVELYQEAGSDEIEQPLPRTGDEEIEKTESEEGRRITSEGTEGPSGVGVSFTEDADEDLQATQLYAQEFEQFHLRDEDFYEKEEGLETEKDWGNGRELSGFDKVGNEKDSKEASKRNEQGRTFTPTIDGVATVANSIRPEYGGLCQFERGGERYSASVPQMDEETVRTPVPWEDEDGERQRRSIVVDLFETSGESVGVSPTLMLSGIAQNQPSFQFSLAEENTKEYTTARVHSSSQDQVEDKRVEVEKANNFSSIGEGNDRERSTGIETSSSLIPSSESLLPWTSTLSADVSDREKQKTKECMKDVDANRHTTPEPEEGIYAERSREKKPDLKAVKKSRGKAMAVTMEEEGEEKGRKRRRQEAKCTKTRRGRLTLTDVGENENETRCNETLQDKKSKKKEEEERFQEQKVEETVAKETQQKCQAGFNVSGRRRRMKTIHNLCSKGKPVNVRISRVVEKSVDSENLNVMVKSSSKVQPRRRGTSRAKNDKKWDVCVDRERDIATRSLNKPDLGYTSSISGTFLDQCHSEHTPMSVSCPPSCSNPSVALGVPTAYPDGTYRGEGVSVESVHGGAVSAFSKDMRRRRAIGRRKSLRGGGSDGGVSSVPCLLWTGSAPSRGDSIIIERLGWKSLTNASLKEATNSLVTHVVASAVKRTTKFLWSVCRGLPVVNPKFVEASGLANQAVEWLEYALDDTEGEDERRRMAEGARTRNRENSLRI